MVKTSDEALVAAAVSARGHAHAPFSHYPVGAAVLNEADQAVVAKTPWV